MIRARCKKCGYVLAEISDLTHESFALPKNCPKCGVKISRKKNK